MIERLFRLKDNRTTVRTEIVAGLTTFMTMAYILAVNPDILSASGMPKGGVFVATALAAVIGTLCMALFANYPFVLAAGMGLNAYFAFSVCGDMGYSWPFALLAVFVEGLVFLLLSATSVRESIFNAIPISLKKAVAVGIGLFITLIALKNAGILVSDAATYVKLVPFHDLDKGEFHTVGITALLALLGILVTAILLARKVPGAILLGIFATWLLGIATESVGLYRPPKGKEFCKDHTQHFSTIPSFSEYGTQLQKSFSEFGDLFGSLFDSEKWEKNPPPKKPESKPGDSILTPTCKICGTPIGFLSSVVPAEVPASEDAAKETPADTGAAADTPAPAKGWALAFSLEFFVVMFAFFFVDLFDTLGTLIGVSLKGGFLDKKGRLPRISGALYADSIATSVGAVFGTSTTTTFVESSAGVAAGGKTGLTAVTAAGLFLLSLLLAPIFLAIPSFATTPALVVVGFLMMGAVSGIDFNDVSEGLPAFLCIVAMPLFYSISDGIMFGVISYTLVNLLTGRAKKISPVMYVLTVVFLAKYALM